MTHWVPDGRTRARELTALVAPTDTTIEIQSPGVGLWRGAPGPGSVVAPGTALGELEVLGVLHRLVAPSGAHGVVTGPKTNLRIARLPVGYRDTLLVLDSRAGAGVGGAVPTGGNLPPGGAAGAARTGLVFQAPSSGRFYVRPGPDKPPFVAAGDTLKGGQVVALLEVMKTFNRIAYGGAGLPDPARVVRIIPDDGADVEEGDPLVELEPA